MRKIREGSCFGRFELLDELGAGGMGRVYRALDPLLEREVALKVLTGQGLDRDVLIRGVMREGKLLARLNHRNIVHLYEASAFEGTPYFAMELVTGCTLRRAGSAFGATMEVFDALAISAQIGEALCVAHGAGIIHNDLKPENVMVTSPSCFVKLVDFGLSRNIDRASTGTTAELVDGRGTPHYMAPELHRGERATAKSDVYAWGQMTHELLTHLFLFGQSMDDVPSRREVAHLHLTAPPASIVAVRGELLQGVERIVWRMVAKDPAARPTAAEAHRALQAELRRLEAEHPALSDRTLTAGLSGPVIVRAPEPSEDSLDVPDRTTLPRGSARPEPAPTAITVPSGPTVGPVSNPAPVSVEEADEGPRVSHRMRAFLTSRVGSAVETSVVPSESIAVFPAPPKPDRRADAAALDVAAAPPLLDSGRFGTPPPVMRSATSQVPAFATERKRERQKSWLTGLVIGLASAFAMFAVWLVRADIVAHLGAEPTASAPSVEVAPAAPPPLQTVTEEPQSDPPADAGANADAGGDADAGPSGDGDAGTGPVRDAGPAVPSTVKAISPKPKAPPKPASAPPGQRVCDLLVTRCSSEETCSDPKMASSPSCNHAPQSTLSADHPLLQPKKPNAPSSPISSTSPDVSPAAKPKAASKLPSNHAKKKAPPSGAPLF